MKGIFMIVSYNPDKLYDAGYFLGALCYEFLKQFGEKAESIISLFCYRRGLALGKVMAANLEDKTFETAIKAFVKASEKSRAPAKLISLEENRAVLNGTVCPFGLNGNGRKICEAMMNMDKGILEKVSGERIKCTVDKTIAAADNRCEVIFEVN
jgi:hypothetical protein